ncbi:LysR substrate-binding domain-containing protein [Peribacillus butanolivorans]|uniref:LysR substrate-binding domain-containing protein n=1 Tax=Peribacillus butanolivorans TaxID=421767 RepID=UPI0036637C83
MIEQYYIFYLNNSIKLLLKGEMLELRQIKYFLMLCDELHFTEAAYKLGISQPTLSQQIRVLEDELNTPLFDRIGKKTVLTEAGALFQQYALQMVHQMENAKLSISDLMNQHTGSLRVAVFSSDLDYRLTPLLVKFHKEYPKTKIQMLPSNNILNNVLNNEADIGIGLAIKSHDLLHKIPLYTEAYSLYVRDQHELTHKKSILPEELSTLPMVMYPKGFIGRDLIEAWCETNQVSLQTIMETGSATSLIQLVQENIGATIQPSRLIDHFRETNVTSIPINNPPTRELGIFYRKDRYISTAAHSFIKKVVELLQ